MGPVDEESQTFTMDCYFRQYWNDFRLKFKDRGLIELPMNWQFLTKIWRPDTVFINGKNSYLHKMTVRYMVISFLLGIRSPYKMMFCQFTKKMEFRKKICLIFQYVVTRRLANSKL